MGAQLSLKAAMPLAEILATCRKSVSNTGPSAFITGSELWYYRKTSNISHTLVCNKIVDHSDVVGASPVGAAATTSSYLTQHLASMDWVKTTARRDEKHWNFEIWCNLYKRFYITYGSATTAAERKSDFKLTTDTPYPTLMGELWGVYYEDFEEIWPLYNGTTLFFFCFFFQFTCHCHWSAHNSNIRVYAQPMRDGVTL